MNTYFCNICTDNVKEENIVRLKCNPSKHIFCYDCIYDWYIELKKQRQRLCTMCPICRKNGGTLPLNNKTYIKNIHNDPNKVPDIICGYQLVRKKSLCTSIGYQHYDNLCSKHYLYKQKHNINTKIDTKIDTLIDTLTNTTIDTKPNMCVVIQSNKECGAKLKTKDGFCKQLVMKNMVVIVVDIKQL